MTSKESAAQEKTKTKILKAALQLFMDHGFAGTSISQIAEAASVTKSLIYHHFINKRTLWRAVKLELIEEYANENNFEEFSTNSLREFISDVVKFRFRFYWNKPQIARLMMWQRLEKEKASLERVSHPVFASFLPKVVLLQKQGKLNKKLDPLMVEYLIMSISGNPVIDNPEFLRGRDREKKANQYVELLIDGLCQIFAP